MAKWSLSHRALAAVGRYVSFTRQGGTKLWLKGHAAGMRDARKELQPQKARLFEAVKKYGLQHEAARKAEHEMNIQRLRYERECANMRVLERERERRENRRAAMMQSRLPANNGGFGQ